MQNAFSDALKYNLGALNINWLYTQMRLCLFSVYNLTNMSKVDITTKIVGNMVRHLPLSPVYILFQKEITLEKK